MITWAADKISSARNALFINDHRKHPKNHNISLPEPNFSQSNQPSHITQENYGLVHFKHSDSIPKEAIEYSNMSKPTGVRYQSTDSSYENNIISFEKKDTDNMANTITATKTYNGVKITENNMTVDFSNRPKNNSVSY
jgi:hypothetical protein